MSIGPDFQVPEDLPLGDPGQVAPSIGTQLPAQMFLQSVLQGAFHRNPHQMTGIVHAAFVPQKYRILKMT